MTGALPLAVLEPRSTLDREPQGELKPAIVGYM